ncbi:MAG TPA: CoA transferase [Trebonia sp.]|jgi:crotonobetainyl-CoA:carnitine CoA-transferase CaiB-like acyl-CoA transferase|nr:CoA transferase [Trebonia sp.]
MSDRQPALAGIKVLDLSRFIAGPLCAMFLADLGAEVIKVETARGDENRSFEPRVNGKSVQTMAYNRNKRGFVTDPRSSQGRANLTSLARWADVVVENFRPGVIDAMGLGYNVISRDNPGVILTSVSGFGQDGPYRDRPLFDPIAQAMSGLMNLNATADGEPKLTGTFFGDHFAGLYAALGTLAALQERERSGRGQHVDVSVFDSLFSVLGPGVANYVLSERLLPDTGNRDPYSAPANLFHARDGAIYVHAGTQALFGRLCEIVGQPSLAQDERFSTVEARLDHLAEVEQLVADWVAERSCAEADKVLTSTGIPCGIVADVPRVSSDPQVDARGMIQRMQDADGDPVAFLANPVRLSATPVQYVLAPPKIGQHNEEVHDILGQLP